MNRNWMRLSKGKWQPVIGFFSGLWIIGMAALLSACAGPAISPALFDMTATPLQAALGQKDRASGFQPRQPDLQRAKALVEGGADVNFINAWGSALHVAARSSTPEMIEYLLAHGATLDLRDPAGFTPLMWAARMGKLENVKLLVDKGANLNAVAQLNSTTPLGAAAHSGRYEIVTYLMSKGADASPQVAGAAFIETATGMSERLKEVPAPGAADAKAANEKFEYVAILELLLSKGATVNSVDQYGQTALHLAANYGNPEVTRYFLKAGVDPNITAPNLGTALAWAQKNRANLSNTLQQDKPLVGMDAAQWAVLKKILQVRLEGMDQSIAMLAPLTSSAGARPADVAAQPSPANVAASPAKAGGVGGQVADTVAGCAKLKAALLTCDKLPWPASTGCSALARSQFGSSVCPG